MQVSGNAGQVNLDALNSLQYCQNATRLDGFMQMSRKHYGSNIT